MKVADYIRSLIPYQPGKPIAETQREYGIREVIKLASNENPLGPSPSAIKAAADAAARAHIYPDASSYELAQVVADHYGLEANHLVFGNGSNELIDLLIRTFCQPGDQIITTQRAFIAYRVCAQAAGVGVKEIGLRPDFGFDFATLTEYCRNPAPKDKIIFIPNPNNPTGAYSTADEVDRLLAVVGGRDDILVVFDEAYFEFVTAKDFPAAFVLAKKHKNVLVLRTFSKVFAMAGLRLGFLYGDPTLLEFIQRVRNPFNVNIIAQSAGMAALGDHQHIVASQKVVWEGLETFYQALERLKLFFIRSQGNFVLFDTGQNAAQIYQKLLQEGVIMRPVANYGLPNFLRLSVGLPEENQRAIAALEKVLKSI